MSRYYDVCIPTYLSLVSATTGNTNVATPAVLGGGGDGFESGLTVGRGVARMAATLIVVRTPLMEGNK